MALNQRIAAPIPTMSIEVLLRALNEPQKALELWDKYRVAREEYEALRAAIVAEKASLDQVQVTTDESRLALEVALVKYGKAVAAFEEEQRQWDATKSKTLSLFAQKEQEFQAKNSEALGRLSAAATKEAENAKKAKEISDYHLAADEADRRRSKELDAREAAVVAREKKADALAKLLQEV